MIEMDIKIEAGDLYDYMLAHTFNGPSGILGSTFGAVLIIAGMLQQKWFFVIAGVFLLLYLPWTLFIKSRRQALENPAFKQTLHYCLDEEGISVSQGDVVQKQAWADMYKAVSTSKSIIVYTNKINATIFPKRELGDRLMQVIGMISTHMPPDKVKIRS